MKLKSYSELLKMSKEKLEEAKAPIRAKQMRKAAEMEMLKLEENIVSQEQTIQDLTSKFPIDFNRVIDAIDELELTKRRIDQFRTIISDLFPEK